MNAYLSPRLEPKLTSLAAELSKLETKHRGTLGGELALVRIALGEARRQLTGPGVRSGGSIEAGLAQLRLALEGLRLAALLSITKTNELPQAMTPLIGEGVDLDDLRAGWRWRGPGADFHSCTPPSHPYVLGDELDAVVARQILSCARRTPTNRDCPERCPLRSWQPTREAVERLAWVEEKIWDSKWLRQINRAAFHESGELDASFVKDWVEAASRGLDGLVTGWKAREEPGTCPIEARGSASFDDLEQGVWERLIPLYTGAAEGKRCGGPSSLIARILDTAGQVALSASWNSLWTAPPLALAPLDAPTPTPDPSG